MAIKIAKNEQELKEHLMQDYGQLIKNEKSWVDLKKALPKIVNTIKTTGDIEELRELSLLVAANHVRILEVLVRMEGEYKKLIEGFLTQNGRKEKNT